MGWQAKLIDFGLAMRADAAKSTMKASLDRTLAGSSIAGTVRCQMDRGADALVGAASANVGHRLVDVSVRWPWCLLEQCCGRHDLARLAIPALWHVEGQPCLLDGMALRDSPSMVTILSVDLTSFTRIEQERCTSPLMCTEQAPHWPIPQPYLVPVRPSCSRNTHNSGVSPSTTMLMALPFTFSDFCWAISSSPPRRVIEVPPFSIDRMNPDPPVGVAGAMQRIARTGPRRECCTENTATFPSDVPLIIPADAATQSSESGHSIHAVACPQSQRVSPGI